MNDSILRSSRHIRLFYILADLCISMAVFFLAYLLRYNPIQEIPFHIELPNVREYSFIFILWFIFILIFFQKNNLYTTNRGLSIPKEILRVSASAVYASILIAAVIFFAQYKFFSRLVFLSSFISVCVFLSLWRAVKRLILRKLILSGFHNINILIVGAGKIGEILVEEVKNNPWLGLKIVGFLDDKKKAPITGIPVLGTLGDFSMIAKKYFVDEVIVTIPSERGLVVDLIKQAKHMALGISMVAEHFDERPPIVNIIYLGMLPLISYKEKKPHPAEFALKTFFDFFVSLVGLIALAPLFILVAVFIKLESVGPVFYIQRRVGSKGRLFNLYKFRSMIKNADTLRPQLEIKNEVRDGVLFKIKNDPRITRVGHFLRRTSLDELPQLINVVRGEMSLVGPRPPTPDEVEKYHYTQMLRLSIKPGITGMSQVKGRSDLTFRRWVKWDIWYVNNWSFGLDMKILLWTIPSVMRGRGAY